ncbi:MAG: FAD-dependent oxidoreductase [Deltaproteobacteria bacterium]|nr:FAD-dependent oxidoreductase [Deltaproteobacteria bacterium]
MRFKDVIYPFTTWKHILNEPRTIKHPEDREGSDRYRGFHTNDIQKCIGCGSCEEICQNEAIDLVEVDGIETTHGDSGLRPKVDYGRCCWCALCVDVCTTNSLGMSNRFRWAVEGENELGEHGSPEDYRFVIGAQNKYWDNVKEGYKKPDSYDLTPSTAVEMDHLSPSERSASFVEMMKGYTRQQAQKEADRCVECGICIATCPAHMGIPAYIKAVREDDLEEGLRVVYDSNPLPEVCGRVCTHKCETVCAIGHKGDPVSIRWLKRYIADHVPAEKYAEILGTKQIEKNGKKVAVIGSGPAGLSAAHFLSTMGYAVTVLEALPNAGGMMRYGIPEYRLPYDALDKDINYIQSLGVEFKTNCRVGTDVTILDLKRDFDAVFAATGLPLGRSTRLENADHKKVFQSIDLLREITLGNEIIVPEKIVVIGGGNVAMDITRSLARMQKQKFGVVNVTATCLEPEGQMPADDEEVIEAREEGAVITPGYGPQSIEIKDADTLLGLRVARCVRIFDEEGRFNPSFNTTDTRYYEADMIVESIGQSSDMSYLKSDLNIAFGPRGQMVMDADGQVNGEPWLFVGGDMVKGPDVITGIATGHFAAMGIDRYLNSDDRD